MESSVDLALVVLGFIAMLFFLVLGLAAKAWILSLVAGFVGLVIVAGVASTSFSVENTFATPPVTIYLGTWGVALFLIIVMACFFVSMMQGKSGNL